MHYAELGQAWAELTAPGSPFEIVEVEVRGEMLRAFRHAPPSVREIWLSTLQFADRDYLIYQDERLTYGQAHAQVNAVAAWLTEQGVRPPRRGAPAPRPH